MILDVPRPFQTPLHRRAVAGYGSEMFELLHDCDPLVMTAAEGPDVLPVHADVKTLIQEGDTGRLRRTTVNFIMGAVAGQNDLVPISERVDRDGVVSERRWDHGERDYFAIRDERGVAMSRVPKRLGALDDEIHEDGDRYGTQWINARQLVVAEIDTRSIAALYTYGRGEPGGLQLTRIEDNRRRAETTVRYDKERELPKRIIEHSERADSHDDLDMRIRYDASSRWPSVIDYGESRPGRNHVGREIRENVVHLGHVMLGYEQSTGRIEHYDGLFRLDDRVVHHQVRFDYDD